jgi:hypothetical protein
VVLSVTVLKGSGPLEVIGLGEQPCLHEEINAALMDWIKCLGSKFSFLYHVISYQESG